MTYEELLVQLDEQAKTLTPAALRLLLHLIAACIRDGGNQISISTVGLSKHLGAHRDTVREAIRKLSPIMLIDGRNGVEYTFTLPHHWFSQSRGLFAALPSVENPLHLPENQAGTCLENGQVPAGKTDRHLPENQAGNTPPAEIPGRYLPEKPTGTDTTCLENGQVATQNQQLGETAHSRSRSESVCYPVVVTDKIYQIANTRSLPVDLIEPSSMLCDHLRAYAGEFGNPALAHSIPDELILARCLAVAPLGELVFLLRTMRAANTRCGQTYAWFVTIFAQRIHRIKAKDLTAAFTSAKEARAKQQRLELGFGEDLVTDTLQKVRRWA